MLRFSGYFRRLWVPLFFASFALAQTASITGLVSDSSGAVVSGANVTAKSDATGLETRVQTNEQGYYNLLQLAP